MNCASSPALYRPSLQFGDLPGPKHESSLQLSHKDDVAGPKLQLVWRDLNGHVGAIVVGIAPVHGCDSVSQSLRLCNFANMLGPRKC